MILGKNVHLETTPVEYTYNFGNGTTMFAVYEETGNFWQTVTTGFRGAYSVNGGPPLPITGPEKLRFTGPDCQ